MKVELRIKKRDLHSILCAAVCKYYCEVKWRLEPHKDYLWQLDTGIIENSCDIRDACDAIACLCNMIDELDTVDDNDALGKIVFDPSAEDEGEQK